MPRSFLLRQHQRGRRRSRDPGAINAYLSESRKSEFQHEDICFTVLSNDRADDFRTMEMGHGSITAPGVSQEETFAKSGKHSSDSKAENKSRAGDRTENSDSQKRSENNELGHLPSSAVNVSDIITENDVNVPRSAFTSSQVGQLQPSDAGRLSGQMADATNLWHYETSFISHPSQTYPCNPVPVTLSSPTYPAVDGLPCRKSQSHPDLPIADWAVDPFSASVNAQQLCCKMLLSGYKVPRWPCAHRVQNILDCRPVRGFSTPMQQDGSFVRQRMRWRENTLVRNTSKKSARTLEEDGDCGNVRNRKEGQRSKLSSGNDCHEIQRFGRRIESVVSSVDTICLNRFSKKRTCDGFSTTNCSEENNLLNRSNSKPFFAANRFTSKKPSVISTHVETDFHVRPETTKRKMDDLSTRSTCISEKKCLLFKPIYSDSQEQNLEFGCVPIYSILQDGLPPASIYQEQNLSLLPSVDCSRKRAMSGTLVSCSDRISCLSPITSQYHDIERLSKASTSKAFFPADALTVKKSSEVSSYVETDFSIMPETEDTCIAMRKVSVVRSPNLCKELFPLPEKDSDNTIKLECDRNNSHTNASMSETIVFSIANAKSHKSQDVVQPRRPVQNGARKSSLLAVGRLYRPYLDCPRGFSDLETPRISLPVPGFGESGHTKKYPCDLCGRAFSRTNTLVTHRRIHTGEKPFRCDICGREFRQPGNLTRHRLIHTSIKPYACAVCLKAFNRLANLHTHMRTHERRLN